MPAPVSRSIQSQLSLGTLSAAAKHPSSLGHRSRRRGLLGLMGRPYAPDERPCRTGSATDLLALLGDVLGVVCLPDQAVLAQPTPPLQPGQLPSRSLRQHGESGLSPAVRLVRLVLPTRGGRPSALDAMSAIERRLRPAAGAKQRPIDQRAGPAGSCCDRPAGGGPVSISRSAQLTDDPVHGGPPEGGHVSTRHGYCVPRQATFSGARPGDRGRNSAGRTGRTDGSRTPPAGRVRPGPGLNSITELTLTFSPPGRSRRLNTASLLPRRPFRPFGVRPASLSHPPSFTD